MTAKKITIFCEKKLQCNPEFSVCLVGSMQDNFSPGQLSFVCLELQKTFCSMLKFYIDLSKNLQLLKLKEKMKIILVTLFKYI